MSKQLIPKQKVTLAEIKAWRQSRHDAGLPCGLENFFTVNGICRVCRGSGEIIGAIPGRYLGEFVVTSIATCEACNGTGKTQ